MFQRSVFISAVSVACCVLCSSVGNTQKLDVVPATPNGWEKSVDRRLSASVFTKLELEKDETLVVKFFQRKPLETNQNLEQWLSHRLVTSKVPLSGQWTSPPVVVRQTGNMIEGTREFKAGEKNYTLKGLAVGVDKVHVRFAVRISSNSRATRKHRKASTSLLFSLMRVEKEAAVKDKRGTDIEINPPKVKNLVSGGPIKPGRYVGNQVNLRDNKTRKSYDLIVFENGEYEFLKGGERHRETGRMVYSRATGRLNVAKGFMNSTWKPEEDYCVFGKEKTGKWVIYSREGRWQRKLVWVSTSDRPSPSEVARAEASAKAEAKRYKHVVEPGEGIKDDEIEAMMYAWETNYRSGAVQLDEQGFLVMKDGRVFDGLPVAPDSLDVAASRSREPDRWGWWKQEADGRFTFSWPVRPRDYRQPNGAQVIGVPFKIGTRIKGDFGSVSTQTMIASGFSSVRRWGIKFSDNGRFMKYRSGSTQAGGAPGMPTLSTVVWDDESAVAASLGSNVTTMSKRRNSAPGSDRMGKYEFDGFRLTLKFDDGHVEHHATFTDKANKVVWFEGSRLTRKEKKKK